MESFAKAWIEVSRGALRSNARVLRRAVAPAQLMAVVKANAYGHGIQPVVAAFKGYVDWFGVDSLEEALAARLIDAKTPILILGYVPIVGIAKAVKAGFSVTVYDQAQLKAVRQAASSRRPAKIHVKIETGTSRQGVAEQDWLSFAAAVRRLPNVRFEGMSTHYANIEDTTDDSYAKTQLRRFHQAVGVFAEAGLVPSYRHTAASAAAMLHEETRLDLVRGGLAMYGYWPSSKTREAVHRQDARLELIPALTMKAVVAQVKRLAAGTPVSYGLTERVARESLVAVLPVGYFDGLPRALSSVGQVLIRGQRAKILGRVCMNMCVVDVTGIAGVKAGDVAVIIGRQGNESITAEEIADKAGSINYELLSRLNPLLERRLVV